MELCLAVFSYLNVKQLLRAQAVCRQWQQIILYSYLWPCSVSTRRWNLYFDTQTWRISWPDWTNKEKEQFECSPQTTRQVIQTLSKGSTKSFSVWYYIRIDAGDIFDVLPNFRLLKELSVCLKSISSHELTSLVQSLSHITTFRLDIDIFIIRQWDV